MDLAVQIVKNVVIILLTFVQFAMLIRAVLSWFPLDANRFTEFLFGVTEPFIQPIRALFVKMNWFQGMPIDISFLISYMLISAVLIMLP